MFDRREPERPLRRSRRPRDQLPLPHLDVRRARLSDSSFTENRDAPVHRWVPWIAGYSAQFVADILARLPVAEGRQPMVLDPFAGVGTTLVEALRHGSGAVGFEINPYAALACTVKLRINDYDQAALRQRAAAFTDFVATAAAGAAATPAAHPPSAFRSRVPFFSPSVERQVLFALDFIAQEPDEQVADVLRVALGATLVSYSNYSYEPSLSSRQAAGKPPVEEADVAGALAAKLEEVCADVEWWHQQAGSHDCPQVHLHRQSCTADPCPVPPGSVDLVVTSPPYLNNYHYPRNTRPQLYWLGLVSRPADTKRMEHDSFGKFWQTVRAGDDVPLKVELPELTEAIEDLRARNGNRGVYGGRGWANYAATYFNDCDAFCRRMSELIRPGGLMVVVIGNNIVQGIEFKTDEILAQIAEQHGFELGDIHQVRKKRTGSSIINSSVRSSPDEGRVELYESAVELRRALGACVRDTRRRETAEVRP
jgi:DNA modification methylase